MSARSARILMVMLLLAPAADAGWFGGDSNQKKLPKPIKLAVIRPHDAARLRKPSKIFSKFEDPSWGASGPTFYRSQRLRVSHQNKY